MTKVAVLGASVPYKRPTVDTTGTGGTIDFSKDFRGGDLGSSRVFADPNKSVGPYDGDDQDDRPGGVTVVQGNTADVAADADFVVVVAGLTAEDEGEEYTLAGDAEEPVRSTTSRPIRSTKTSRTTSSTPWWRWESRWWSCSRGAA